MKINTYTPNLPKYLKKSVPVLLLSAFSYHLTDGFQPTHNIQDRIVPKVENPTPTTPINYKILGVDVFGMNNVCINNDGAEDVPHGEVVSKILESGLSNADIHKRSISPSILQIFKNAIAKMFGAHTNPFSIVNNLDTLFSGILKRDEKYDAINMSLGLEFPYDELSDIVGFDVNPENYREQRKRVRDSLVTSNYKTKHFILKDVAKVLDKMDSITVKGTRFYVSAGNDGVDALNLLTLAKDIECVGARRMDGWKKPYTERHNLVTRYEFDEFSVEKTEDGFDITGDGKTDFTFEQMAFPWFATSEPREECIHGTSFATPNAIIEDIKASLK